MTNLLERAYHRLMEKMISWYDAFIQMLPNLLIVLLILFFINRLANIARKLTGQVIGNFTENTQILQLFRGTVFYVCWIAGISVCLNILHLDKPVTSLLAGAGVIGLALSFAFQDLATNFISGLFIIIERPFNIGDFVETNGFEGHIEKIGVRSIVIKTLDDQHVIIPSKDIFQKPLKNYNLGKQRRITLKVGVAYHEDLEKVRTITKQAVGQIEGVVQEKGIHVHFFEFDESSINFELRFWIDDSDQMYFLGIQSLAVIAIQKAYQKESITIPFPIRTVDFGMISDSKN